MTTLVGVLGWPVSHSRSPAMHNAAFEALGLDWRYELLPVEPERFDAFVRELPGRGFVGANVTIPHKLAALALADRASDVAQRDRRGEHAELHGPAGSRPRTRTSAGFLAALWPSARRGRPPGMDASCSGAGGAARAASRAAAGAAPRGSRSGTAPGARAGSSCKNCPQQPAHGELETVAATRACRAPI